MSDLGSCLVLFFLCVSLAECRLISLVSVTVLRGNYRGADKSLARPTSRCILFDGENIFLC